MRQIILVRIATRINAANTTIATVILFTSIRFNCITSTSTFSITIMIIAISTTISITVAVTVALTSFTALMCIIMMSHYCYHCHKTNCTMNVTIITASGKR